MSALGESPRARTAALAATLLACASCHPPTHQEGASLAPAGATAPPAATSLTSAEAPPFRRPEQAGFREMLGMRRAAQFPLDSVEEEPKHFTAASSAIVGAPDFLFVLGQGSGWHGFDTLKIDASGQAELVFGGESSDVWRRAAFRLSAAELAGLQRELAAIDVFALKRAYLARVDDGTQWFVRVQAAQQRKTVVLDNHFPDAIVRVADHVRTRIVAAHRDEIAGATQLAVHGGKLDERMDWPEDVPPRPPTH